MTKLKSQQAGFAVDAEIKSEMIVELVCREAWCTLQFLESSFPEIAHRDQDLIQALPHGSSIH